MTETPEFPNNLAPDWFFEPTEIEGVLRCCARKTVCSRCGFRFPKKGEHDHNLASCPECGGHRRCMMRTPKSPSGRCKHHGGKSLRGVDSKTHKHGRYSRVARSVPDEYRDRFLAFLADPDLLDNTNQIALLAARWQEQTETLSSGENKFSIEALQDLWGELQTANKLLAKARSEGDEKAAATAQQQFADTMSAIGKMIKAAASKFQAWEDWKETTRDLSALRLDQAKMRDFQSRYMAAEYAIAYGIALRDAVMGVLDVRDREDGKKLQQIVAKLDEVMGRGVMTERELPGIVE